MISINTNTSDLLIQRSLGNANQGLATAMQRLASGCRINNAGDDAAGLSLSTKQNLQIRGLSQAKMNTQTGINLLNIAGGSLDSMLTVAQRMRDLAVQSANGVYSGSERQSIQKEVDQLTQELSQIKDSTKFNDMKIFEDSSTTTSTTRAAVSTGSSTPISKDEALAKGYIVIETAQDFVDKIASPAADTAGKKFMLVNDIDMSTVTGYQAKNGFAGLLNGNGYKLSNLSIYGGDHAALFASVEASGVVKNLTLSNFTVSGGDYSAALASGMYGRIENCHLENSSVTGNSWTGGLVSGSTGDIVNSSVKNSCNIKGNNNTGGLLSSNAGGSVVSSYVENTTIEGLSSITGGLVATSSGTIEMCYADVQVNARDCSGGLVGQNSGNITKSYSKGTVTGNITTSLGGLVGDNSYGNISDCFSEANVQGTYTLCGGLIGNSTGGSVSRSLSVGNVQSGRYNCAGFVGGAYDGTTFEGCFWDTDTSGWAFGEGSSGGYVPGLSGQTTSNLMTLSGMFAAANWSNEVWDFSRGYPSIKWSLAPSTPDPTDPSDPGSGGMGNLKLQIGTKNDESSSISIDTTFDLGGININVLSADNARNSIKKLDELIEKITLKQSVFGSNINRLSSITDSQDIKMQNLSSAKSTILDADIAKESSNLIKNQILQQAAASLLLQSKDITSSIIIGLIKK